MLVVRLRSLGDTVLSTPTLFCLRRFLPRARIDVLLEGWVAPLLAGSADVSEVLSFRRGDLWARVRMMRELRRRRYDVAVNLHGGTTATLLTWASRARYRVGYRRYQYSALLTHRLAPSHQLWSQAEVHSAEEQLALVGGVGVPVSDRPATRLAVAREARDRVRTILSAAGVDDPQRVAVLHPGGTLATKRWASEGYVQVARHLRARGLTPVVALGPGEAWLRADFASIEAVGGAIVVADLEIEAVIALVAEAQLFVGNDSGLAHVAAAVRTPAVVVFSSSNPIHWRPWASAPTEIVRHPVACAPCPGYTCDGPVMLACLNGVTPEAVIAAYAPTNPD